MSKWYKVPKPKVCFIFAQQAVFVMRGPRFPVA